LAAWADEEKEMRWMYMFLVFGLSPFVVMYMLLQPPPSGW
jgi:hypothetical protein